MSDLADAVLPLIRTRADLSRWSTSNEHGRQMHEAVDILEAALATEEPQIVHTVTHKALTSAIKIIARADDSSGIIGDACVRLLDLHPRTAAAAHEPAAKLIDWMMTFQFKGEVDYFQLDPVAYAPALGERGVDTYRAQLAELAASLSPLPPGANRWDDPHLGARHVLESNAKRLAVLDRDVEAIIETHVRDRKVAAWFEDTAKALEEIGEVDLAIDWAKQATDFDSGHQSATAARRWCRLLAEHRPDELLEARREVFHRWPTSDHASGVRDAAGNRWPELQLEVMQILAARPHEAVLFALHTLKDAEVAWNLAHELALDDNRLWSDVAKAYGKLEPLAVLPVLARLVHSDLEVADAMRYRIAARRLAKMRKLAAGSEHAAEVDRLIAEVREVHRRRPRLMQELDKAGLP